MERKKIGFRSKYKRNQDPSQYGVACRPAWVGKGRAFTSPKTVRPGLFLFFPLFFCPFPVFFYYLISDFVPKWKIKGELQRLMWSKWAWRRRNAEQTRERAKAEKTQKERKIVGDLLYDSTRFLKEWLSCCCLGNSFEIKEWERKRENWKLKAGRRREKEKKKKKKREKSFN